MIWKRILMQSAQAALTAFLVSVLKLISEGFPPSEAV